MSAEPGKRPLGGDTSPDARRVQIDALRAIPAARRLELANELTVPTQKLAREGLRQRHPGATEAELDDLYAELTLGPELAARVREHREKQQKR